MEASNFDKLFDRYLRDEVTEQERIKIEAWLEVKKAQGPLVNLSDEEEEKIYQRLIDGVRSGIGNETSMSSGQLFLRPWVIGIAATLVVAVSAYLFLDTTTAPSIEKNVLPDGTLVWLRGDSKIKYNEIPGDKNRYATLTGNALFEVAKDRSRPFIISCQDIKIKVLGTSFNVHPHRDTIDVEVLTGSVKLFTEKDTAGQVVEALQKISYTTAGHSLKNKLTSGAVDSITSQTEYTMKFNNEAMTEVFKRIEKKFDVVIEVTDTRIYSCKITADFTDLSLTSTLNMIADVLNVQYTVHNKKVMIAGSGCQ